MKEFILEEIYGHKFEVVNTNETVGGNGAAFWTLFAVTVQSEIVCLNFTILYSFVESLIVSLKTVLSQLP